MNLRKIALRSLVAVCLGALVVEGTSRFCLFADVLDGTAVARAVRSPSRFAATHEQLYWYLQDRFMRDDRRKEAPNYDAELGWLGSRIASDRTSTDEARIGDRRLVLLYGDSYSACTTRANDCFQGLMDDCALGRDVGLLNLGVGGYGLDQIAMLVEESIDYYAAREPIVIVGILLDDDLDRCMLDFRCWPKPRMRIEDGELVPSEPVAPTIEDHWRLHPPPTVSYAWRFLQRTVATRFGAGGLARDGDDYRRETEALTSAILARVEARLRDANVRHFYLLYEYSESLRDPRLTEWRKRCVTSTLDALGAPWLTTKTRTIEAAAARGSLQDFFGTVGRTVGHFNARGNQVVFRTILDGLAQFADVEVAPENYTWLDSLDGAQHPHVEKARASVGKARFALGGSPDVPVDRLDVECDAEGRAEIALDLGGRARRFAARAMLISTTEGARDRARMTWTADGEKLAHQDLRRGGAPMDVELDLTGRTQLVLTIQAATASTAIVRLAAASID
ncbi:MAG: hypothetical protein HZA52_03570 [Planctomycetes bacterium]|nr:hypothetical protein [Planctomycetota bacterium]